MSILSWLKNAVAGKPQAPIEFKDDEKQLGSLDMKGAIDAHMAWKARLQAQIAGEADETLEVAAVASDRNCALGKWIFGEAKQGYGWMEEYATLRDAHARFHACAGAILKDAQKGARDAAEQALKGDLRRNSEAVQLALVRLYAKVRG